MQFQSMLDQFDRALLAMPKEIHEQIYLVSLLSGQSRRRRRGGGGSGGAHPQIQSLIDRLLKRLQPSLCYFNAELLVPFR